MPGIALVLVLQVGLSNAEPALPRTAASPKATDSGNVAFTPEALEAFYGKIVARTDDFWHGDHWLDHRATYNWVHANAAIYYILAYATMSGDTSRIDRIRQHYAWSKKTYWVPDAHCWINASHEVMANACVDLNVACGLDAGAGFLPADLRTAMEDDLRGSLTWLQHKTTGALNDADLRACNQDGIAAAAFAMASRYFRDDAGFRQMGLDRYRMILAKSQGPFWTEGGIDKGYQLVGEPAFALAVDLLWNDLTLAEKRRAAEILMRPYAAPTLGLEKMRSESTLGAEPDGSMASAYLHRVPNPCIEHDVIASLNRRQTLRNPWWFFDTPQVAYYVGVLENAPLLRRAGATTRAIGWGGTARLAMKLDEFGRRGSIDEKTYLASPEGMVALFGDVSGWDPAYAMKKRKVTALQKQFDPGGLRYVGKDRTVIVWADGEYDFPRLVFGDAVTADGAPTLVSRACRPGFVGSQYDLTQALTRPDGGKAGEVNQQFVIVGRSLIARFVADETAARLPNLRYEVTVPATNAERGASGAALTWSQGSLYGGDPVTQQQLTRLHGPAMAWNRSPLRPYLVHEPIRNWVNTDSVDYQNLTPAGVVLTRAVLPLDAVPSWFALSTAAGGAALDSVRASLRWTQQDGGEVVTLDDGGCAYAVLYLAAQGASQPPAGVSLAIGSNAVHFVRPAANVFHLVRVQGGQVRGLMTRSAGVAWNGQPVFTVDTGQPPADVSLVCADGLAFVDVSGGTVRLAGVRGNTKTGTSLFTGEPIDLRQPIANERLWYP